LIRHQYCAVAHVLSHLVNQCSGPKSGFKHKCRASAAFGLQNEANLQPELINTLFCVASTLTRETEHYIFIKWKSRLLMRNIYLFPTV